MSTLALFPLVALLATPPEAPSCKYGPDASPELRARAKQALMAVREINTLQAEIFTTTKRYGALEDVASVKRPEEFELWLVRDVGGLAYMLLLRDTSDECGFGYASDGRGVILETQAIQRR